jgi:hypothetical protein
VNCRNGDTRYHSENEFMQAYAVMVAVSKRIAIGVNGFYYQQTTDDRPNGVRVKRYGLRGRDFAIGPEVRIGHYVQVRARHIGTKQASR